MSELQGIGWGLIAVAFSIAITAPTPTERPPSQQRKLSAHDAAVMAKYCSRYPSEHFERCMFNKTELFGK